MALEPLNEEQLDELSDEELEQRVSDERAEELKDSNTNDESGEEPEVELDESEDLEPENTDDEIETDDEVEEKEEETSESGEDNPDEGTDPEEEDTKSSDTETPTFRDLKVNGEMIPINNLDELYTLASGGGHMTQQLQKLSKGKKSLSIMEEHNLTEADLSLLIEARSGNKDALASLVKQSGIDYMDMTDEVDENYQPGQYVPSDESMNLRAVQEEISMDPEYATTQNVVNNLMDERSQQLLVQNPMYIKGLHMDIKSGAYQVTQAHATKMKMMDGGVRSDMEYYIAAAQEAQNGNTQQASAPQTPDKPAGSKKPSNKSNKRSAGSSTAKAPAAGTPSPEDMSDDDLMAYREKIMSR